MIVTCQQQDVFKVRDGAPGHGPKSVVRVVTMKESPRHRWSELSCGCSLPESSLPTREMQGVREWMVEHPDLVVEFSIPLTPR